MGTTPRSIQSVLHTATPGLPDLLGRAQFFGRIRAALVQVLPEQAAPHVRVGGYEQYRLRLHVGNAGWGTRLRYMKPAITQALAQRMRLHVDSIEIRIRPVAIAETAPPRPRPMSNAARGHLQRTAAHIDDTALANALLRLAAAGRSPGHP